MSTPSPNRSTHRTPDRAVSPVIGVVLMVAITVILAAAIGAFVFAMTPTDDATAPVAQVTLAVTDNDNVSLTHEGGDPLDLGETTLLLDGEVDEDLALDRTLRGGQAHEVQPSWAPLEGDLVLRHDPSGEIIARRTIHAGS